jgi:regulator of replication initiation timing
VSIVTVIGWALILMTALVRWRREIFVSRVGALPADVAGLKRRVGELEVQLRTSAEEREELQAENDQLRRRCTRQAKQIKKLRTELNVVKTQLDKITRDAQAAITVATAAARSPEGNVHQ